MKNLKMFAISLLAFLVMASGVHAAENYAGCKDGKLTDDGVCVLDNVASLTAAKTITKNLTIDTQGHQLTIDANLTINDGVEVTIKGGNVRVGKSGAAVAVTIGDGAKLLITGNNSTDYNALTITNANVTFDVKEGATLSVSGNTKNKGGAFVIWPSCTPKIVLNHANLLVNDNNGYGMNGAGEMVIEAHYSNIEAKNNSTTGIGADFQLYSSKITATGNGLSGVTLGTSKIDSKSEIDAKGNLTSKDKDAVAQKADVVLKETTDISGKLTAGSFALEKHTWGGSDYQVVDGVTLNVEGTGVVVDELKPMCNSQGITGCGTAAKVITPVAAAGKYAVVTIGDEARLYANAEDTEITLDKAYDNLVVMSGAAMKKLTVVSGTTVTNGTNGDLVVYEVGADRPIVVPAAEGDEEPVPVTVGVKAPEDQTGNTGDGANTPEDGTTGRLPNEPAKTNDNILVYAGLGLVSALTVGFSARRKENN